MLDVKEFISNHIMVTSENATVSAEVLVNDDGGEFNFKEGVVTEVEKTPKSWVFVTVKTGSGDVRKKVRSKAYYDENPFSIGSPVPHLHGDQSDVYFKTVRR
jgi:hypothetical protein